MWSILILVISPVLSCDQVKYADDSYDEVLAKFFNKKLVMIAYATEKKSDSREYERIRDDSQTKAKYIIPGIFIDFHSILTAYNPFRVDKHKEHKYLEDYKICVLKDRTYDRNTSAYVFEASEHTVVCARQVAPVPETWKSYRIRHGFEKEYSPLHDLMVFRINPREYAVRSPYNIFYGASIGFSFPVPVHIAKEYYALRSYGRLIVASSGFRDMNHLRDSDTILSRSYSSSRMLADCDEWIPRWWGHFICLNNVDNFVGVGAGAMLIQREALYGIGSFMIKKHNRSILVFTDVRKYYKMYGSACHEFETNIRHDQSYDRDTFWYYSHHKRIKEFYNYAKLAY